MQTQREHVNSTKKDQLNQDPEPSTQDYCAADIVGPNITTIGPRITTLGPSITMVGPIYSHWVGPIITMVGPAKGKGERLQKVEHVSAF